MRKLTPELLDHLPHDDSGAISSRKDLRRINFFMGNEAWIVRQIPVATKHVVEIGAGDGNLISKIAKLHPDSVAEAYDLAPKPRHLPEAVRWIRGNIFEQEPPSRGGVLIANLFLHHFTDSQLSDLVNWFPKFDTLIFNEPLRSNTPLVLGKMAHPFIHPITRHDMRVSIEAGFIAGELPQIIDPGGKLFSNSEKQTFRGALRSVFRKLEIPHPQ
ncbi:class I SAM-dependent methyltransferase [Luteolibacter sp. AS25]|uniref:class I SAM-dependent methyltransferase n=1 Tax=Luteolibacter sp. AS25 TaxID=3135776 RepID=UPI00398AAB1B